LAGKSETKHFGYVRVDWIPHYLLHERFPPGGNATNVV
jgi:hypothetical protein